MPKNSGQVAGPIGSIVVGLVFLFVGLYMVDTVAGTIPAASVFGTTSLTDDDNYSIDNTAPLGRAVHTFAVTGLVPDEEDAATVALTMSSPNGASGYVGLYFNGVFVSNISITNNVSVNPVTVTAISDITNNASYQTWEKNITIDKSVLTYLDNSKRTATTGKIYDNIVSTTGTSFTVLGLVLIIVGLAMAISSLRRVSE